MVTAANESRRTATVPMAAQTPARRATRFPHILEKYAAAIAFVVVIAVWELGVRLGDVSALILPPPSLIVRRLYEGLVHGTFLPNLGVTLLETFLGFGLAAVLGIGLGALVAEIRWIRRAVYPYVVAFQTIPMIALAPLLVIWFGFGITSKVLAAGIVAFFPIIVNTIEGVSGADAQRVDMIRAMGASRMETFRRVKAPSALPFIFAGLDTAIVLALLGAVVGEFMGATAGLGNQMLIFNAQLDIASSFAVLVLLSACGLALHFAVALSRRWIVFWVPTRR